MEKMDLIKKEPNVETAAEKGLEGDGVPPEPSAS